MRSQKVRGSSPVDVTKKTTSGGLSSRNEQLRTDVQSGLIINKSEQVNERTNKDFSSTHKSFASSTQQEKLKKAIEDQTKIAKERSDRNASQLSARTTFSIEQKYVQGRQNLTN